MMFVHDDADWEDLLQIVAERTGQEVSLVEKDYWVTHALYAIVEQGFEVWFKGGTSLSKGFGLIERFSEDIDVRIDRGSVDGLAEPRLSWKNDRRGVAERDIWFDALAAAFEIPGCQVRRNPAGSDARVRGAWFETLYPGIHTGALPEDMRPFVLLEVGRARVEPCVHCDLSSWVHDHLVERGQLSAFVDNRPRAVRCIHPWVTCLEKVEAIARKFDQGKGAADFVRHYEDAARIIESRQTLPALGRELRDLVDVLAADDRKAMPASDHPAFSVGDDERWSEVADAYERIGRMFWGERLPLAAACATIRRFLVEIDSTRS